MCVGGVGWGGSECERVFFRRPRLPPHAFLFEDHGREKRRAIPLSLSLMLQKQFKSNEHKRIYRRPSSPLLLPRGHVRRRGEALAAPAAALLVGVREDERRAHLVLDPVHRGAHDVHQSAGVDEDLDRRPGRGGRRSSVAAISTAAAVSAAAAAGCLAALDPSDPDLYDLVEPRGRIGVVERVGEAVAAAALDAQAEVFLFFLGRRRREVFEVLREGRARELFFFFRASVSRGEKGMCQPLLLSLRSTSEPQFLAPAPLRVRQDRDGALVPRMQKKTRRHKGSRCEREGKKTTSSMNAELSLASSTIFFLTLCLFSSKAFTRSIAAGVSATGAFLCRRRRDRGEGGGAEAGGGEEGDGVVASSLLAAEEAASAANNLRLLAAAEPPLLLLQLLPLVDAVRAEARRAIKSLAVPPPLLPPATAERRSAAISHVFAAFFSSGKKK